MPSGMGDEKPLAFDAASIKPSGSGGGGRMGGGGGIVQITPGRVLARNVTARRLVLAAYRLTPYQLSGGPAWLDSDRFELEAKAETASNEKQLRLMLQTLLGQRLKLVVHRETEEMRVYALVVGKNGPKIYEVKEGERLVIPPAAPSSGWDVPRKKLGGFCQ
jgi:uncharacterized protein (TIGR03435 family)